MAILSYFAAHWVLAIATTLIVVALGAAAYVFKNLKFALAALIVAIAGFLYQGAVTSGIKLQMQKELAAQAEMYKERIDTLNSLAIKNAMQAKADAEVIDELEKTASETPKNTGACLDAAAAGRVRAIRSVPKSVAPRARRYPTLFQKGSR